MDVLLNNFYEYFFLIPRQVAFLVPMNVHFSEGSASQTHQYEYIENTCKLYLPTSFSSLKSRSSRYPLNTVSARVLALLAKPVSVSLSLDNSSIVGGMIPLALFWMYFSFLFLMTFENALFHEIQSIKKFIGDFTIILIITLFVSPWIMDNSFFCCSKKDVNLKMDSKRSQNLYCLWWIMSHILKRNRKFYPFDFHKNENASLFLYRWLKNTLNLLHYCHSVIETRWILGFFCDAHCSF